MKKPSIKNLKEDKQETAKVRTLQTKQKSIKITINLDSVVLAQLKEQAEQTGVPYQRLINRLLQQHFQEEERTEDRLDKIEQELKRIKEKLAA